MTTDPLRLNERARHHAATWLDFEKLIPSRCGATPTRREAPACDVYLWPAKYLRLMREIERKFLVRRLPDLTGCPRYEIEQGYLATELGKSEVRLRRCNDDLLLTVKRDRNDGDGIHSRDEVNISLSAEQWATLWPMTEGRRVIKDRYEVPCGECMIELDVFKAGNEGIVTAEVEFNDPESSHVFVAPDWLGEEVTRQAEYSNWKLAR